MNVQQGELLPAPHIFNYRRHKKNRNYSFAAAERKLVKNVHLKNVHLLLKRLFQNVYFSVHRKMKGVEMQKLIK